MANGQHDPDDIRPKDVLPYLFPCPTFIRLLGQHGFDEVVLTDEVGQANTFNLQMTAAGAGLTVPAARHQLAQTVEQIPADGGVTWHTVAIVVQIDGQIVRAQFNVDYDEQP